MSGAASGVTMAQATDALGQLFGPAPTIAGPSFWDVVVGIPIEDWMRADTPEQVEWLAWLRDHPMPPPPAPECICEQIDIPSFGSSFIRAIPGRPNPRCPRHGIRRHG